MTSNFEVAFNAVYDGLDDLHNQSDGMRTLEMIFSLERIAAKANEMIHDLQCSTATHNEGKEIPSQLVTP